MLGPGMGDALLALRPTDDEKALMEITEFGDPSTLGQAREVLQRVLAALHSYTDKGPTIIPLTDCSDPERALIRQVLREGEVAMRVDLEDGTIVRVHEAVTAGVWQVEHPNGPWLEVGDVPAIARGCLEAAPRDLAVPTPEDLPEGAMNVASVMAEIRDAAQAWEPGMKTREITLTLLPMTDVDLQVLTEGLGMGPLDILSFGYGNCRIMAAATRYVWHLQYFNSEDKLILHTVQVGDVPVGARADAGDLVDSSERLEEIIKVYFPLDS